MAPTVTRPDELSAVTEMTLTVSGFDETALPPVLVPPVVPPLVPGWVVTTAPPPPATGVTTVPPPATTPPRDDGAAAGSRGTTRGLNGSLPMALLEAWGP